MNISPDGKTVSFKTDTDDLFMAEKSGAKPNTVRIIDSYEHEQLKKKLPRKIIIQHEQEIFLRTLTNVYVSDMVLGKYLAIFSWINEDHHHCITSKDEDHDFFAHTMSISQEPEVDLSQGTILLPMTLIHELIALSGDGTLPPLLERMIKAYTTPTHCHPPAWTFGVEDKTREADDER